jgi:hypothetical protein
MGRVGWRAPNPSGDYMIPKLEKPFEVRGVVFDGKFYIDAIDAIVNASNDPEYQKQLDLYKKAVANG